MDYRDEAPEVIRDFLSYHEVVRGHSRKTIDEYYLDLRNFFRYMKQIRDPLLSDKVLDEIDIRDIDLIERHVMRYEMTAAFQITKQYF